MPALTDKIFFPISIFVLNVTLAVFKFVLASAVGACFAIYAKYGGEYAKSIGWVRSAGYLDMIMAFLSILKRKNAPGSVMWVLVVGFFITFAADFLDKGISNFVVPTSRLVPFGRETMVSPQVKSDIGKFFGWSFVVPSNGNVTHTMEKALNSSLAIPNQREGEVYYSATPEYPTTCTDFGITFCGAIVRNGSCGRVDITLEDRMMEPNIPRPSNRLGFNSTSSSAYLPPYTISDQEDKACNLHEDSRTVDMSVNNDARISRTSTTKCFHGSGDITVLVMTATRLAESAPTNDSQLYSGSSDELFSTMYQSIMSATIPEVREFGLHLVELRMTNSSVDILACSIKKPFMDGGMWLPDLGFDLPELWIPMDGIFYECSYATITVLRFKQNNDIAEAFGSDFDFNTYKDSVYISLEYSPAPTNETVAPLSAKNMTRDNVAVADFMASLGTNYYADFRKGLLYIRYDVRKRELGLEVPLWVLLAAGIIVVVSVCVWQMTHWLVGLPHTSSVYSIIRAELGSNSETPVPRIMRFSYQPLMFEGVKLLPDKAKTFPEDIKSV
ncbi:MAG: hypothetical protein J3Q66DRAFT_443435 [Benniella sp.]|nr:MAG: hypothetical protein J3Q66DRAFT_443435 [Benniella sp.]